MIKQSLGILSFLIVLTSLLNAMDHGVVLKALEDQESKKTQDTILSEQIKPITLYIEQKEKLNEQALILCEGFEYKYVREIMHVFRERYKLNIIYLDFVHIFGDRKGKYFDERFTGKPFIEKLKYVQEMFEKANKTSCIIIDWDVSFEILVLRPFRNRLQNVLNAFLDKPALTCPIILFVHNTDRMYESFLDRFKRFSSY